MSAESARKWLQYAEGDLKMATYAETIGDINNMRLHIQQCIEKSLKAVLIYENREVPHTHNLLEIYGVMSSDWSVKNVPCDLKRISTWVIIGRYPVSYDEIPAEPDAKTSLDEARTILYAVKSEIKRRDNTH